MSGVTFEADIDAAVGALGRLTEEQLAFLVDEIANLMVEQTNSRFSHEKRSPDGDPWAAWSPAYAKTRNPARHSLLDGGEQEGLRMSIDNYSTVSSAIIGTNLLHAATHQFGSANGTIPARPYLGLSADNRIAIEDLVIGRLEDLLQ